MRIPKSIRWFVVGALARQFARLVASRSVDKATENLQQVLPPTAARVVSALPDSVVRAGGAAVATGKATRRAANSTLLVKQLAGNQSQKVRSLVDRSRSLMTTGRGAVAAETAKQRRSLRSEFALQLRGQKAADEAMLDLRPSVWRQETDLIDSSVIDSSVVDRAVVDRAVIDRSVADREAVDSPVLPSPADAIPKGRPKRSAAKPTITDRVQRLYRAPVKAWDRPRHNSDLD